MSLPTPKKHLDSYKSLPLEKFNHLLEGYQILDFKWRYLYVNEVAAQQIRYTREDLIGRSMLEVFPGIEGSETFNLLKQCMKSHSTQRLLSKFVFPEKSENLFDLKIEPIREGIIILSQEVGQQNRMANRQQILYKTLQLIHDAKTTEALLNVLIKRIESWSQCEAIAIRIKNGEAFPYAAFSGFSEKFINDENLLCFYKMDEGSPDNIDPLHDSCCLCSNVIENNHTFLSDYFDTDGNFYCNSITELVSHEEEFRKQPQVLHRCQAEGYESIALIPLQWQNDKYGLLHLCGRRKNQFSTDSIALLRMIADRLGHFIARDRAETRANHLYAILAGIRKVNRLIAHENDPIQLIEKASELLVRSRGFKSVASALTDQQGKNIEHYCLAGEPQPSLEKVLKKGEVPPCAQQCFQNHSPYIRKSPETEEQTLVDPPELGPDHDQVALPLEQQERVFGFMVAYLPKGTGDDDEQRELLQEAADDISYALHSISLQDERDKANDQLHIKDEQLIRAQKLESVGRLAGGVAHDFNNMLGVIIGYAQLGMYETSTESPVYEKFQEILQAGQRSAAITRQLLAFARQQVIRPVILDLNDTVESLLKMLRRLIGENIELTWKPEAHLWPVRIDPAQVDQILANLCINARDAITGTGHIAVETSNAHIDESYFAKYNRFRPGRFVLLTVSDDGCGMDKETLDNIFEPFFTTKGQGQGTGLGMPTVYGIVKQNQGFINVYSENGKGTTIKIYLEACFDENQPVAEDRDAEVQRGEGELILLVDDDDSLRKVGRKMLENLGYRVLDACSPSEAIAQSEKNRSQIDLLITDVIMPEMDGKTLVQNLKALCPELKVLYMSGYTADSIARHGVLDSGINFIQKPFLGEDLAKKVREALDTEKY